MLLYLEHAPRRDAHRGAQDLLHRDRRGCGLNGVATRLLSICNCARIELRGTEVARTYARRAVQLLWEADPRSKTGMVVTFDTAAPLFWPTAAVLLVRELSACRQPPLPSRWHLATARGSENAGAGCVGSRASMARVWAPPARHIAL